MSILKKATNLMAYGKVGIFGFQGSGKTYTATNIAIGICALMNDKRIAYFDTETGSDWVLPRLQKAGIEVFVTKTRAFGDLLEFIRECESEKIPVAIIDSITHIWRDLCDSYDKKLKRKGRLQFQDWNKIKTEWRQYTDLFVNSKVHIIACGRAGYNYDYDFNQDGTKDLIKTGTKMKAETEFGFEPSLVIEMEQISENRLAIEKIQNNRTKKQSFKPKIGSQLIIRAHVLKDRADRINGQVFDFPTYENFKPHFDMLNIGGEHFALDTTKDSTDRFDDEGNSDWRQRQKEKEIALEEIQNYITEVWPGTTKDEKAAKLVIVETIFGSTSWTYVQTKVPLEVLKDAVYNLDTFRKQYRVYLEDSMIIDLSPKEQIQKIWKIVTSEKEAV